MTTPRIEEMVSDITDKILDALGLAKNEATRSRVRPSLHTALTQARQAGIDDAVERVKRMKQERPLLRQDSLKRVYDMSAIYNEALDDTIKALQDNK